MSKFKLLLTGLAFAYKQLLVFMHTAQYYTRFNYCFHRVIPALFAPGGFTHVKKGIIQKRVHRPPNHRFAIHCENKILLVPLLWITICPS